MPEEFSRTTARKTIILPGGETMDVPVISKISFLDPNDRAQETQHFLDNSRENSSRTVHVDQVYQVEVDQDGVVTNPTAPTAGTDPLYVERIDVWRSIDVSDRGQETQITLDNKTGNDALPPHFFTHAKTHIYRYFEDPQNPDNDGTWIDSELIDEFSAIDPSGRYQESHYFLSNPTNAEFRDGDLDGQASPDDPNITIEGGDGEGTQDNPVRLDPFQNIVNYSGGVYVLFAFSWQDFLTLPLGERCNLVAPLGSPSSAFTAGVPPHATSAEDIDIICSSDALESLLNGATDTGGQPEVITTGEFAQGYWKFPPCFVCSTQFHVFYAPPGDPHAAEGETWCDPLYTGPPLYADPVPYNKYERSFLFDIAASEPDDANPTAGNTATTKIEFDIFGLPAPRLSFWVERTLPTYPSSPGAFQELNFNFPSGLNFRIYVFSKSAVDLYLTDKVFPLRKKGIIPTAPDAVDQTKQAYKAFTNSASFGWTDEGHMLHEYLSDADTNTGESGTFDAVGGTGSETVNLKFHFEKFEVGPGNLNPSIVKREIAWPVEPDDKIVTGLTGFTQANPDTPVFGTIHIREYQWFYKVNEQPNTVLDEFEKHFGELPMGPPTA